jgi:hypothetical protein
MPVDFSNLGLKWKIFLLYLIELINQKGSAGKDYPGFVVVFDLQVETFGPSLFCRWGYFVPFHDYGFVQYFFYEDFVSYEAGFGLNFQLAELFYGFH